MTAGITPSRTSEKANVASAAQTAMSAAAIRPRPPARAGPATRARTGFGHSQIAASTSPSRADRQGARGERGGGLLQVGAGAEDRAGVASSTITRTAGSAAAARQRREQLRVISAVDRALRLCGLSRVSVATPGRRTVAGPARASAARSCRQTRRACPVHCPTESRYRAAGELPGQRAGRRRRRTASASTCTCRSAPRGAGTATSTRTRAERGRRAEHGYVDAVLRRAGAGRAGYWPTPRPRVDTVFVGGGTPTLLPPAELARILDGDRRDVGTGRRRRGHHRGQPRVGRPGVAAGAARGRVHPDLARDAVGRAARAGAAGPPAHPGPGGRPPRGEAREAGLRARQPGPDLRHAGRDAPTTSPARWPRCSTPGSTTSARTR